MGINRAAIFWLLAFLTAAAGLSTVFADRPAAGSSPGSEPTSHKNRNWTPHTYQSALKYVDETGLVDYEGLKLSRNLLDNFSEELARLSRDAYSSWNREEQIAFWLNAYNGLTLLTIVNHYPIQPTFFGSLRFPRNSVRQISGVWDRNKFVVMGAPTTLDQIEHEILRKSFSEPRIHVALVCAAMGCPPLRNQPYEGAQLDSQLNDQARRFLGHPMKFRIDRGEKTVYLSKILDWYGEDFVEQFSGTSNFKGHDRQVQAVLNFVSGYLTDEDSRFLRKGQYQVRFLTYDWSLNEQRSH